MLSNMLFSSLYLWNSKRKEDYIGHCTADQPNNTPTKYTPTWCVHPDRCSDMKKGSGQWWPTHKLITNRIKKSNTILYLLDIFITTGTVHSNPITFYSKFFIWMWKFKFCCKSNLCLLVLNLRVVKKEKWFLGLGGGCWVLHLRCQVLVVLTSLL